MNSYIKKRFDIVLQLLFFACIIGLIYVLYKPVFSFLINYIKNKKDFDYIYLAPVVLGYLAISNREKIRNACAKVSPAGLIPFILGILLFWVGELAGEYYSQFISLLLIIIGCIWSLYGIEVIKSLATFFAATLIFIPLPNFIIKVTTEKLQLLSSKLGVALLHLLGKSVYREGNIIDLGFYQLQVIDACSGLRYLFPLMILALIIGHLFNLKVWKRIVLVLSTIPMTIGMNAFRIAITAILMENFGPKTITGVLHNLEGVLVFLIAFTLLNFLAVLLKSKSAPPRPDEKCVARDRVKTVPSAITCQPHLWMANAFKVMVVIIVTLGISSWAYSNVDFRKAVPPAKPLEDFPTKIGQWTGHKKTLSKKFIDALDLSSYILIDYQDPQGNLINFYVAYYEAQRKGESIHSPGTCLRGSGWLFKKSSPKTFYIPGIGKISIRSAELQKGKDVELVYYWFQRGQRIIDNVWALKWYVFWDALTKRRTDGALVRIIAPVMPNESKLDAQKRMDQFLKDVVPILSEYLPSD